MIPGGTGPGIGGVRSRPPAACDTRAQLFMKRMGAVGGRMRGLLQAGAPACKRSPGFLLTNLVLTATCSDPLVRRGSAGGGAAEVGPGVEPPTCRPGGMGVFRILQLS